MNFFRRILGRKQLEPVYVVIYERQQKPTTQDIQATLSAFVKSGSITPITESSRTVYFCDVPMRKEVVDGAFMITIGRALLNQFPELKNYISIQGDDFLTEGLDIQIASVDTLTGFVRVMRIGPEGPSPQYCSPEPKKPYSSVRSPDIIRLIEEGEAHRKEKNFSAAIPKYDTIIDIDPSCAEAWNYKGLALQSLRDTKQALICFSRAVSLDDRYPEAWYHKGNVLAELGDFDAAIKCYDRSLSIDPSRARTTWYLNGATVYYNKANVLASNLGRYEDSLKFYARAVELDDNYPEALKNWGAALHHLRRYDEAIILYDQALALNPPYPQSWYAHTLNNKADALESLGCGREAREIREYLPIGWDWPPRR